VPDTCDSGFADKLEPCTPIHCSKPSPMEMMFGFPSEDELNNMPLEQQKKRKSKAAAEKKVAAITAQP